MPEHDDRTIADALRAMPVPEHGPGFWIELEARLAAVDAGEEDAGPRPVVAERAVVPLVVVPAGGDATGSHPELTAEVDPRVATSDLPVLPRAGDGESGPSHTGRWLAVAAAVLVVAVGAVAFGLRRGDGDGGGGDLAAPPTTPATDAAILSDGPDGAPVPSSAPEGVPPTSPRYAAAGSPEEAVELFLAALGAGDEAGAARTLGPRTIRYISAVVDGSGAGDDPASAGGATPAEPVLGYVRELMEGYGAWAGVEDRAYETVGLSGIDATEVAVVLVSGSYRGEGAGDPDRVDAFAAVDEGDGWRVELHGFDPDAGGRLQFTSPEPADDGLAPIAAGGLVEVFLPTPTRVGFVVDGELRKEAETTPVGQHDDPYANLVLPDDLEAGPHSLVIVAFSDEAIYAQSFRLVVEPAAASTDGAVEVEDE